MEMKKYDNYKDSGVEWIGKIPSHWMVGKVKYSETVIMGQSPLSDDCNSEGIGLPFLQGNAEFGVLFPTPKLYCESTNKTAEKNDILLSVRAPVGAINLANQKVGIGRGLCAIRPINSNTKFIYYWLLKSVEELDSISTGSTFKAVNLDDVKSLNFPIIDYSEQTAIANFLDQKTAQIDSLIAKKEELIQLLEEERTAIINQAVTKGLDPTAPMKDSGIEWLGEIPEGWEVKKLRFVGNCQNGVSAGAEYFGSGFPFVSYSDVYKNEILPANVDGLAQSTEKEQLHYSVQEGDVFFTRTSETVDEIGIASTCYKYIEQAVFAGFLIRFRPNKNKLVKEFSRFYFKSLIPRTFFVKEMNIVTRASLSQELLKRLPVLLPPIEEQKEIALFLDEKTKEIDCIVSKTNREIELLKEYKTALISEVVTGKVDVRNEKLN